MFNQLGEIFKKRIEDGDIKQCEKGRDQQPPDSNECKRRQTSQTNRPFHRNGDHSDSRCKTVIIMGRVLTRTLPFNASSVVAPASFAISLKSMRSMEFFTTIPESRIIPMNAARDCYFPAISNDQIAPIVCLQMVLDQ